MHVDLVAQPGNRMPRPIDPAAPLEFVHLGGLIKQAHLQNHKGPYVRDLEVQANAYT